MTTADPRHFRNALGCFGTGVCIITAKAARGPVGLTVNSFASVSLDPPLILWSLDKASDRSDAFHVADRFAVNVLHSGQRDLATLLAKKGAHDVPPAALEEGPAGIPVIRHALAQFVCRVDQRYDAGDHVIFVGHVEQFGHVEEGHPLIFYRGKYRGLAVED